MAADAVADGRPLVLLVFADFDPSGHNMSVVIARKFQALRDLHPEWADLDARAIRAGLTLDQVKGRVGLPGTPLKPTERRADRWREAMGHEQTELDAIATLQPAVLRRIAVDMVEAVTDPTLADRVGRRGLTGRSRPSMR